MNGRSSPVNGRVAVIGTNKARELGVFLRGRADVVVLTEPWYAPAYEALAVGGVRVVGSVENLDELRRTLDAVRAETDVTAVVGPAERTVQPAAYLRSYYGLPGTPFDVAVGFTAKHLMKRRLNAAGIPTARYVAVTSLDAVPEAAGGLGFPAVVKRALGAGSTHTHVLRSPGDVSALVRSRPEPLTKPGTVLVVEEFLEVAAEYHSEALVERGQLRLVGVAQYLEPLLHRQPGTTVGSSYLQATDPAHAKVAELHRAAVSALGLRAGVTHLEVLTTADGRWLVGEIAARPAGGAIPQAFKATFGVDLWRYFLACEGDPAAGDAAAIGDTASAIRPSGWIGLPIAPGVVRRIGTAGDLSGADDVLYAEVLLKPGDTVSARFHSSSMSGYVIYVRRPWMPDAEQVAAIASQFRLEIA